MLMPTKHIKTENALIGLGAEILSELTYAKPVSTLFHNIQLQRHDKQSATIHFDWFLLAVDFLYIIGAVDFKDGLIEKINQ